MSKPERISKADQRAAVSMAIRGFRKHRGVPILEAEFDGWAVTQKAHALTFDDVFDTRQEAADYKRDAFQPEHKAKLVKITIKIEERF